MTPAIERVTQPSEDVVALLGELNRALDLGYAPEQRHALSLEHLFQPQARFFVARADGAAVACGGIGF